MEYPPYLTLQYGFQNPNFWEVVFQALTPMMMMISQFWSTHEALRAGSHLAPLYCNIALISKSSLPDRPAAFPPPTLPTCPTLPSPLADSPDTDNLVNNGNMYLANTVLQFLVYCPPFRELFRTRVSWWVSAKGERLVGARHH
jgi:hypothetical protein